MSVYQVKLSRDEYRSMVLQLSDHAHYHSWWDGKRLKADYADLDVVNEIKDIMANMTDRVGYSVRYNYDYGIDDTWEFGIRRALLKRISELEVKVTRLEQGGVDGAVTEEELNAQVDSLQTLIQNVNANLTLDLDQTEDALEIKILESAVELTEKIEGIVELDTLPDIQNIVGSIAQYQEDVGSLVSDADDLSDTVLAVDARLDEIIDALQNAGIVVETE